MLNMTCFFNTHIPMDFVFEGAFIVNKFGHILIIAQ
jgi:hypothetical protein